MIRTQTHNEVKSNLPTVSTMRIYIAWDGDHVGRQVGQMAIRDDVESLRRVMRAIESGNDAWRSWLEVHGGSIITCLGDEGRAQMPGNLLEDLDNMRDRYKDLVGATVSVGIGTELSEAERALVTAKIRGGDRALIYTPSMKEEIAASRQQKPEALDDTYFVKAEDFEDLEKLIGDIKAGSLLSPEAFALGPHEDTFDYSHVLSPAHQAAGYGLHVQQTPWKDEEMQGQRPGARHFDAILHHKGKEVGSASGFVHNGDLNIDTTTIAPDRDEAGSYLHRGKGLGVSMYTALMAHGKHHGAATRVAGGIHSTSAAGTHRAVSRVHGTQYVAPKVNDNPVGDQDNNFGAYSYALKNELPMVKSELVAELAPLLRQPKFDGELVAKMAKMALMPKVVDRQQVTENEWDYSHLLPPHHRNQFRLIVRDQHPDEDDEDFADEPSRSMAHLMVRPGSEVARILAGDRPFPHTDEYSVGHIGGVHIGQRALSVARETSTAAHLHPMLRNNGLGKALYSALYTHALALGRPHVGGSDHSQSAGRVHDSLAREHGFDYEAEEHDDHRGSYGYTLKAEGAGRSGPKQPTIAAPQQPQAEASAHSQDDAIYSLIDEADENAPPPPEETHAAEDFEEYLHQIAEQQAQKDANVAAVQHKQQLQVKQQVAQILVELRQQAPVVEQLRQQAPQIYDVMMRMTSAVVEMARQLNAPAPQEMSKSEVMKKALASIQPGAQLPGNKWDYSHLLSPEHRQAGYSLVVHHAAPPVVPPAQKPGLLGRLTGKKPIEPKPQYHDGPVKTTAHLLHGGKIVGGIDATQSQSALRVGEAIIKDPAHRGGGRGTAMYEALLAHAKNVGRAKYAFGDVHSSSASTVHSRLAARHGLEYAPQANPRTAAAPKSDYDKKYLPYNYDLKSELPMSKTDWPPTMNDMEIERHISKLHTGSRRDLRNMPWGATYELRRVPLDALPSNQPQTRPAVIQYSRLPAETSPPIVITRSGLPDGHHRIAAARLRGDKDMLAYVDSTLPLGQSPAEVIKKFDVALSAGESEARLRERGVEMSKSLGPRKLIIPKMKSAKKLPMPHAAAHHHLNLPAGTVIESTGRFKVTKPDGSTAWKQAKVGVINSREAATAAADWGHPTSSREPDC